MCDVLQKYFDEINWKSDRNIETLIESHKSRGELIKSLNMELDTKKDEFLQAYAPYFEKRLEGEYIKVEDLMKMTMEEFVNKFQ